MDLEHSVLPNGLSHGYAFTQSGETVTVRIPISVDIPESDVVFEYSSNDNSIFCGLRSDPIPLLCGVLSYPVTDASHSVGNGQCNITLQKSGGPRTWPMLISGPSSHGIDPKSEFLLGLNSDAHQDFTAAWDHFTRSAEVGFFPARLLAADVYASDDNPYGVEHNIDESIRILLGLFEETRKPGVAVKAAKALIGENRYDEAVSILEQADSNESRLMLATLLSPLFGKLNKPERAVAIFEELVAQGDPKAMRRLAKHLEVGCGTAIHKERAKELLSRAQAIDGEEPETVEVTDKWGPIFLGVTVGAALLSVGIGVYTFVSRKK